LHRPPLPFPHRDRLFFLWRWDALHGQVLPLSFQQLSQLGQSQGPLSRVLPVRHGPITLETAQGRLEVDALYSGPRILELLGLAPLVGRDLELEDVAADASGCLVSELFAAKLWETPASAVGKQLLWERGKCLVVGVVPRAAARFSSTSPELFLPYSAEPDWRAGIREFPQWFAITRLDPGVSPKAATSWLAQFPASLPGEGGAARFSLVPLGELEAGETAKAGAALGTVAGLLVAICLLGWLMVLAMRLGQRRLAWAIKATAGATPGALRAEFFGETALLVALGSVAGLVFGWKAFAFLRETARYEVAALEDAKFLWFVCVPLMLLGLAVAALLAQLAVRRLYARSFGELLRQGRAQRETLLPWRSGRVVVFAQLAFATAGAGVAALAGWQFQKLLAGQKRWQPTRVAVVRILLPSGVGRQQLLGVVEEVVEQAKRFRGIEAVSWGSGGPEFGGVEPVPMSSGEGGPEQVPLLQVGEDYFATLGVRVLEGREFRPEDDDRGEQVAVMNQRAAQLLCHGRWDRCVVVVGRGAGTPRRVVGVVEDVPEVRRQGRAEPKVFVPFRQDPRGFFYLMVRGVALERFLSQLPALAKSAHPRLAVGRGRLGRDLVAGLLAAPRLRVLLVSLLAFLGVGVSGLGFGAVCLLLSQERAVEHFVRHACGASPSRAALAFAGKLAVPAGAATLAAALAVRLVAAQLPAGFVPVPSVFWLGGFSLGACAFWGAVALPSLLLAARLARAVPR